MWGFRSEAFCSLHDNEASIRPRWRRSTRHASHPTGGVYRRLYACRVSTISGARAATTLTGGLFIALEGGDGAGKTTQRDLLAHHLTSRGCDVVVTREPGGTQLGKTLRRLVLHGDDLAPRAEALLFAADRAHHVHSLIRPALAAGRVVITDRYIDSSVAYQGAGRALGASDVRALSNWATDDLMPDLTVLIDVDPRLAATRRQGTPDRLESEALTFHQEVRAHFLEQAAAHPERYVVVDGDLSVSQVHERIYARVETLLP